MQVLYKMQVFYTTLAFYKMQVFYIVVYIVSKTKVYTFVTSQIGCTATVQYGSCISYL